MKNLLFLLVTFVLISTSCKKDLIEKNSSTTPVNSQLIQDVKDLGDLIVNPNFDWKTSENINLTLTGYADAIVEVKSLSGVVLEKAFLKTNEPFKSVIVVPTTESKVILEYMGQSITLDVKGSTLAYSFN